MVRAHPHSASQPRPSRFNVLLTEDRPHADEVEHWTHQFPRLLEPMGVHAYLARNARHAFDLAEQLEIHAAVVDLATPVDDTAEHKTLGEGGIWLLELLNRMPSSPPIVVVNSPAFTQRQVQRLLQQALRLGAFSVVNKPIELNQLLAVFRKLVEREYEGQWPGPGPA